MDVRDYWNTKNQDGLIEVKEISATYQPITFITKNLESSEE